jgi:hypothetical protein
LGLAVGTCGAVAGARGWASAGATGASVVGGWCGGRRPARDLRERPLNESLPLGVGLRVNALLVYDPDRVVFDKTDFLKKIEIRIKSYSENRPLVWDRKKAKKNSIL